MGLIDTIQFVLRFWAVGVFVAALAVFAWGIARAIR